MTNTTLIKDVFIDTEVSGSNTRTGYLMLQSTETIDINNIKGVIYFESRGRMSGRKNSVLAFNIHGHKRITRNEGYKIPFTFKLSDNKVDSYKGRNVSFSYNCEVQINVSDTDISKLDRSLFSRVKSFVTSDNSINESKYFNSESSNSVYQIVETTTDFDLGVN